MENKIDSAGIRKALEASLAFSNKALDLYYSQEPTISEATKAILENRCSSEAKLTQMVELLIGINENLDRGFRQMQHLYNVEKLKNTGQFKNN